MSAAMINTLRVKFVVLFLQISKMQQDLESLPIDIHYNKLLGKFYLP